MEFSDNNITGTQTSGSMKKLSSPNNQKTTAPPFKPSVFDYIEFRSFLKDAYEYKKSINSQFSENAFIFAAGFGKNSRGYLGLILKGKRNLTNKSIVGFSSALQLTSKEALFFENMVLFCQAETEKEKVFYFERMKVASAGEKSQLVDVLSSQFRYVNEWHLIVLRELVVLKGFKEDVEWISKKLGGKLAKDKILEGLKDLQDLGLLTRTEDNRLVQSDPIVIFKDTKANFKNSSNLHKQFTEKAGDSIINDPYEKRAAQLITLAVPPARFEDLRKEMQEFTKMILSKYGSDNNGNNEQIVQMGTQLIYITDYQEKL